MEIKIGIVESPREIVVVSDLSTDDLITSIDAAFNTNDNFLKLNDVRGRTFIVPAARIAYIEIGSDDTRKVGFSA